MDAKDEEPHQIIARQIRELWQNLITLKVNQNHRLLVV